MMTVESDLLTLEEARQVLRFSKSKLYAERRSGRLRTRHFGRRAVRIHKQDLERYIQAASTPEPTI
jgi:excisionase family DNA binding protein